jgi:Domain of unknown function (DUF4160)
MSTIRLSGFRLVVYANDHPPPHTHVLGAGWEFRIELSEPPALLTLAGSFKKQDIAQALTATQSHLVQLRQLWSELHD